jgi:signal transduction histidine kinase
MKIICLISFLLLFHGSYAKLVDENILISSGYAIDTNSKWDLEKAKLAGYITFKENQVINQGYNKFDAVWCYFKIRNIQQIPINTWLSFYNYHIDSLTLYDGGKEILIGDRTANRSPFIEALSFAVQLNPGEQKILFVRVKKQTSFVDFSYKFTSLKQLEAKSSRKVALVAFFAGIVSLLLMVNVILFFITNNRLYIYYIIYSLLTVIYAAVTSNFAKHILFTDFLLFSEVRVFSGSLWYIALSFFLSYFLSLKRYQPFNYKLIKVLGLLNLLFITFSVFLLIFFPGFDFNYIFVMGYVVFLAAIIILFWAAIVHLRFEKRQAIYALFAFAPQLIWGGCLVLKSFNFIPISLGDNWLIFASLYEVFLFGYVLSRNYIEIFLKNNELMQQVILEKESSLKAISEVQLRERRNIANIIHDKVGSKIAHVVHLFDLKKTNQAKETILELADDIRDISHKILPKALDEGGLISSLQTQISTLNAGLENAEIEFYFYDFPDKIQEIWIYDIYLISLEVIQNAIKHGKAKSIVVEFFRYATNYQFQYTDDGIGFDVNETPKGFGLDNITKRAKYYNGYCEINSKQNQGTIIQIDIPVTQDFHIN